MVENGQPVRFSMSLLSTFTVFDRRRPGRTRALLLPLLQVSLAILLLTALLWPVRWLVRRYHGATLTLTGRDRLGYRLSRASAWGILLILVGWATVVTLMFGDLTNLGGAFDVIIVVLQILTFIVFLGGLAVFGWYLWQVWRGKRRWWAKIWSIALVFAGLVMVWFGFAFHLLSLGANY